MRFIDVTLGRSHPANAGQARYARIVRSTLMGAVASGIGILASFASVPLTIAYLGEERYGAWVTISTLLAWLLVADLGLGNGLTNAIAEAVGLNRSAIAQAHIATTIWLLSGLALILAASGGMAWSMVDWSSLLNVHSETAHAEIAPALLVALLLFVAGFPLTVLEKIYAAVRRGATGNLWVAAGNIAAFVALVIVTRGSGGLIALVVALIGTRLVVSLANAVWLFGWIRPDLRPARSAVRRDSARLLLGQGGRFFLIQAAALSFSIRITWLLLA